MSDRRKIPSPRERRSPRQPAKLFAVSVPTPLRHPLFGEIPVVEIVDQVFGQSFVRWDYDRDFKPPLPRGAVRGNPHQQHFCPMCHVPRYFYVDQERRCVECGKQFVFAGREQKHWFEELHFHFDAVPIRCVECRRQLRSGRALFRAVERAKGALREAPNEPERMIAVAEALVRLREPTGQGDLEEAIRRARNAARSPIAMTALRAEAAFWEAKAHALAGREARARELFALALTGLSSSKRGTALRAEATWWLTARE
jgi:hypothetical protein